MSPHAIHILLLALTLSGYVDAQISGGMPKLSPQEMAAANAACEELARMPNAPMSVADCKAMMSLSARLGAAADDPSARRPGDDAMTCDAIFAELKTMAGVGISEANAARAQAVVTEGTAMATRQAGELTAFMIESQALGAVAGVVGAVTPNFVGAAIAAAWQAQFVALGTKQAAEAAPVRARANETMVASFNELSQSMQENPRFARLGDLATRKGCEPPVAAPK